MQKSISWIAYLTSGLLLAAAFPPLEWTHLVWMALIPALLVSCRVPPVRAFWGGFVMGAAFWLTSIFWLTHVTVAGWIGMSLYCALYMGPLMMVVSWWFHKRKADNALANLGFMLVAVIMWTGFEYIRSVFATGFGWNTLGTCLYSKLPVLQIASLGGVFLLSALVVWTNAGIAVTILRYVEEGGQPRLRWHPELMLALLVWTLAFSYGLRLLSAKEPEERSMRIALVQPNIPQDQKWFYGEFSIEDYEQYCENIYSRIATLATPLSQLPNVDLMVLPETSVPDDILTSEKSYMLIYNLVTNGVPMLVGSMDTEWPDDHTHRYYNSSFLFETNGLPVRRYDKQHLVMFGEYIPFQDSLPFVSAMTPIQESFSSGTNSSIFYVQTSRIPFSILICFEDTVASLARKAVKAGARLLINQTNDAWFDQSSGSRQHMMHSVLRAVENRVPIARAANTGVSCAINRYGQVSELEVDGVSTMVAGVGIFDVPAPSDDMPLTVYTKNGDMIWQVAAMVALVFLFSAVRQRKRG